MYTTIVTEVALTLRAVKGIGKVHEFRRDTRFWDDYIKRHSEKQQVNNWEIDRRASDQEIRSIQGLDGNEPDYLDTHTFVIVGYMSLKDRDTVDTASDPTFQNLLDRVRDALRINNQLNNTVPLPIIITVPVIERRAFGGVLCHYAEIVFDAVEFTGG